MTIDQQVDTRPNNIKPSPITIDENYRSLYWRTPKSHVLSHPQPSTLAADGVLLRKQKDNVSDLTYQYPRDSQESSQLNTFQELPVNKVRNAFTTVKQ